MKDISLQLALRTGRYQDSKMKSQQKDIRKDFLKLFVYELIKNSSRADKSFQHSAAYFPDGQTKEVKETEFKKPEDSSGKFSEESPNEKRNLQLGKISLKKEVSPKVFGGTSKMKVERNVEPKGEIPEAKRVSKKFSEENKLPPLPNKEPPKDSIYLGKVTPILLDPSVFSVECPGPEKNLLVNRGGRIQTATTKLSKEEIDRIIDSFSEKTNIPISQGIFKTAFKDILITAVVSEFAGTRFIIEKREVSGNR